jgi:hypothetical protein
MKIVKGSSNSLGGGDGAPSAVLRSGAVENFRETASGRAQLRLDVHARSLQVFFR